MRPSSSLNDPALPSPSTDVLLIGRAQLGDLRALDRLLTSIQGPLFRHISILLRDQDGAEDALQDVLLTISRKLPTLREPRWFRAWAYRIATREAVRHARRARRLPEAISPDELASVAVDESAPRFGPEEIAAVAEAVARLPPASQLVIRMHYLDGLTQTEVGEALEISVGTVKSRIAYGLAALRKAAPRIG
jgi:RNA polymerase sigma-70 factor (ECF subfamily)